MALKDLLVCLDPHPSVDARIKLAVALAQRDGAHLVGLHIVPPGPMPAYYTPETVEISRSLRKKAADSFKRTVGRRFNDTLRREGLQGELRIEEGEVAEDATLHARYADLAVLGQPDPDRELDSAVPPDHVVLYSGRPVLVVPYIGYSGTVGEHVIVAWNAGREAARAVNDALPLLAHAKVVRVLAINPERAGTHGEEVGADVALHLARHGVKADVSVLASEIGEADMLLSQAADFGADLIVMGAYGHSRARELILGGMTRHLLHHMTVPVFMSH
jgi:nucleotide-binding universal stress UspA family protein